MFSGRIKKGTLAKNGLNILRSRLSFITCNDQFETIDKGELNV